MRQRAGSRVRDCSFAVTLPRFGDTPLARGGRIHVTRIVPEGYQSEIVQVFDAVIPDTVALANQDGEVAAIERRDIASVLDGIERNQYTLEAALVLLDSLLRRPSRP